MLTRLFAVQPVRDQKAVHGRDVVVVLVLGRLHRLRLDQQLALEADLRLVLGDEVKKARQLRLLTAQVRVEQRVVALAAAPQDVVRAAQALLIAASMIEDGALERLRDQRYADWNGGLGASILNGQVSLDELERRVGDDEIAPLRSSGSQELLENLVNQHIWSAARKT